MSVLVDFGSDQGSGPRVVIEVAGDDAGVIPVGIDPGQLARKAAFTFDESLAQVRHIAEGTMAQLSRMETCPSEVKVEFAVKFTADLGAVLAKAGGEANLSISLTWTAGQDGQ